MKIYKWKDIKIDKKIKQQKIQTTVYNTGDQIWFVLIDNEKVVVKITTYDGLSWSWKLNGTN